ncbi:MAG: four helix bundle protein [Leptolyngbya sp. UWPOB_LEPTO1]|uniref:four helix bundle protein n=1 Tax=Leptolyngbya sp. UWPOB_LEPTO1 TaxID=2815653 RepID=UPI001AC55AC8|nr:four helix bundle protein [Leptolyngbya sp. UWPOB_LEPTO1]MBN8563475.1 four helix bundle protein [Leptolyngbya sp. UWPOB_LEPTO1]
MENPFVISYRELRVYQAAFESAMQVFERSREFPIAEQEQLTTMLLRASRSVCVNIAQAWQKRRNQQAFIARLNHAETEAAATQVWIEFAVLCGYLEAEIGQELHHEYQQVLADLARLIEHSAAWVVNAES